MIFPGMDDPANIVALRAPERPGVRMEAGEAAPGGARAELVSFDRRELTAILNIYGRMVAAGEWRDYAIDHLREAAVFSIFRRASEMPLYRVEKRPRLRARQGAYAVVNTAGLILKRGHDLAQVLRLFDRMLLKTINA